MAFVSVYLGLGSNQGDRQGNILSAVACLDEAFGVHYTALSDLLETPSWGFDGAPFLNACVRYRLKRRGTPVEHGLEILRRCKAVEKVLGRDDAPEYARDGSRVYHDRPIDIDILFYGAEHIDTETLTVPHPLIAQRDFVKIPLAQIAKPALKKAFPEIFI